MIEDDLLERLRVVCLKLPESSEQGGVGDPSFKVRNKIFAMQHLMDGRRSIWCKASPGAQDVLVGSNPERFFVPPYVGRYGWIGTWLDVEMDWEEVTDLIEESYRLIAPKHLLARFKRS
jgi:predicted DNA-binding protein (MmcQ/YjbR family)